MGNPISELMGIAKRTVPSSASLKLKKSLIVGILEAQVAKHKPFKKKQVLKAMRCFDKRFMMIFPYNKYDDFIKVSVVKVNGSSCLWGKNTNKFRYDAQP